MTSVARLPAMGEGLGRAEGRPRPTLWPRQIMTVKTTFSPPQKKVSAPRGQTLRRKTKKNRPLFSAARSNVLFFFFLSQEFSLTSASSSALACF